jgi:drug/metabolite transporter (DMT)-like permease
VWAAFLTTILFSISAVCGRHTSRLLGGNQANFWRLCFAASLLAIYAHLFGTGVKGQAFWIFFVSGCIGFGIGDAALFQALPRIGSRLSVLMVLCLSSPIAALTEWAWLGTRLSAQEIGCGLLVIAGVAVALAPGRRSEAVEKHLLAGLLFGVVAAVCQALGAVMSRKAFAVAQRVGENTDGITAAYQRILGGVLVTAVLFWIAKRSDSLTPDESRERWRKAWPWVLLNGLSGPALGVSCYQWALKIAPTGVVLPIVAITPIVIIPFSRYVEGERPTVRSLLAGAVAVAGAVLLAIVRT